MLTRSIESAAAVDPTLNRPQLIGGRILGPRLGQVTIDHELSYDVLVGDEIELGPLICWPTGECGRGQQRGGSDRHDPYLAEHPTLPPRTNFQLGGRHRAGRTVEPSRGLEPEVLAQAALFTIAGGAWSPAVAATGRTVGGGRGLSEGRAGKQRDQRESSDKCLHDTSPGLDHRHRFVHQRRGRSAGACNRPSPSLDREKQCLFPGSLTSDVLSARPHDSLDRSKPTSFGLSRPRLHL